MDLDGYGGKATASYYDTPVTVKSAIAEPDASRRKLSDLIVDILSDKGRGRINQILETESPTSDDVREEDMFLDKLFEFNQLYQAMWESDLVSKYYIDDDELTAMQQAQEKLARHRVHSLVDGVLSAYDMAPVMAPPRGEIHTVWVEENIQNIRKANTLICYLAASAGESVDYIPSSKRAMLDVFDIQLKGVREEMFNYHS
jgi:hypothetical protein